MQPRHLGIDNIAILVRITHKDIGLIALVSRKRCFQRTPPRTREESLRLPAGGQACRMAVPGRSGTKNSEFEHQLFKDLVQHRPTTLR